MDQQTLVSTILREAKRDLFNGRGRIFKKTLLATYHVTEEDFMEAINQIPEATQSPLNDNIYFLRFAQPNPSEE